MEDKDKEGTSLKDLEENEMASNNTEITTLSATYSNESSNESWALSPRFQSIVCRPRVEDPEAVEDPFALAVSRNLGREIEAKKQHMTSKEFKEAAEDDLSNGEVVEDVATANGEMEKSGGEIGSSGASMFNEEDIKEINGLRVCEDRVEVTCGCTSRQYGDAVGTLRVFPNGDLEINCECTPGCDEDKLTPAAFEKHSGRDTAKKWKNNIWVTSNGEKVPLAKTVMLKYYNQTTKHGNGRSQNTCGHRDEFVPCTECGKMRRFRLRNKEECRVYHDALGDSNWKCSDTPNERVTCGDEEERASRRVYRGCSLSQTCRGCTSCVCFGCETCRFSDCSCQTCYDFNKNAKSQGP